ncbi:hypothetical protein D3C77_653430 [compost metagenome]
MRPNNRRAITSAPPNSQYSTVGFHLMNTSLCSQMVAPPKTRMTVRFTQCMASVGRPVTFNQTICNTAAAMATAVAVKMSVYR